MNVADEAFAAVDRSRRYHQIERRMMIWTAVVLVVALAVGVFFAARQNEIRGLIRRQECVARITAEFQGAVAEALAAPPAPNPARATAIDGINASARRLRDLDSECPT